MTCCWRVIAGGVVVAVRVHPKSRRPGLHGVKPAADGPRLHVAVSEAAENGAANRAVCAVLARALGVPPSAVSVRTGTASRLKQLHVSGDPAVVCAGLSPL